MPPTPSSMTPRAGPLPLAAARSSVRRSEAGLLPRQTVVGSSSSAAALDLPGLETLDGEHGEEKAHVQAADHPQKREKQYVFLGQQTVQSQQSGHNARQEQGVA